MGETKVGSSSASETATNRFENLYRQPVSRRISDFLKEEGKRERQKSENQKKKIARPLSSAGLES